MLVTNPFIFGKAAEGDYCHWVDSGCRMDGSWHTNEQSEMQFPIGWKFFLHLCVSWNTNRSPCQALGQADATGNRSNHDIGIYTKSFKQAKQKMSFST